MVNVSALHCQMVDERKIDFVLQHIHKLLDWKNDFTVESMYKLLDIALQKLNVCSLRPF